MNIQKAFKTHDEIINELLEMFYKDTAENRSVFFNTPFDDLVAYHSSLGRQIRNMYRLWEQEWTPVLENGVDVSQFHPDAVSMRIIEDVWVRLHQPN